MTPPFPTDSDEVRAIIQYAKDSGVPYVITSTTNHPQKTTSGNTSRHVQPGTHGKGLAVDLAGPHGGSNTKELEAIWAVFHAIGKDLYELIYNGHQCIKAGKPYAYPSKVMSQHQNHVHVSVNKGMFIRWTPVDTPHYGSVTIRETFEVDVNITNVDVTMPTGPTGQGWATVHYPISKIISAIPQGLRPDVDHKVMIGRVGLADDGANTVVSVENWAANDSAVVRLRVAT